MGDFKFNQKDYIVYLLGRIEPKRADLMCLNKLAFLTEFYFKYKTGKELSDAQYAAIDHGPVINDYKSVLQEMQSDGLLKLDDYKISLCSYENLDVPEEVQKIIDPVIEKYAQLNNSELRSLSHETDSYKISSDNEKIMGNVIDKKLALLETFFDQEEFIEYTEDQLEEMLPDVDSEEIKRKADALAK